MEIREQDNVGHFTGDGFRIGDRPAHGHACYPGPLRGRNLLELGPVHQLWRPASFGRVFLVLRRTIRGRTVGHGRLRGQPHGHHVDGSDFRTRPQRVTLKFSGLIIRRDSEVVFRVERTYTLFGNGELLLEENRIPAPDLPPLGRAGLEIAGSEDLASLHAHPSAREPSCPEFTDWLALRNDAGYGLMVWSEVPFLASLSPVSTFQRSEAFYPVLMTPDSANTLASWISPWRRRWPSPSPPR
jgi:hypothetical protein